MISYVVGSPMASTLLSGRYTIDPANPSSVWSYTPNYAANYYTIVGDSFQVYTTSLSDVGAFEIQVTVHEEPSGLDGGTPISIWIYIGCATSITPASMIPA